MRAPHTELRKALFFKLLGPTLLLLLPLLLLGGSLAEAGVRPQAAEQAIGGQAPSSRLVVRVYFRNTAERDRLATELDALEVPTTGGYLTVISDQAGVDALRRRGLRVEIDAKQTANANAASSLATHRITSLVDTTPLKRYSSFLTTKWRPTPTWPKR